LWSSCESRVEKSTHELLDLLAKHNVKAIFFVLGYIAQRHPELVKEISTRGHIIASHGYWHRKLYEIDTNDFREELRMSLQLLENLTGKKVKYFRAPSWTYDERSKYLHEVLLEEGILVDSSLQPFKTPLSGVANASLKPYYSDPNLQGRKILEFPVPVLKIGLIKIPFCGGFYFRVMPYPFVKVCLRNLLKQRDGFVYIHPWEIDNLQPRPKAPLYIRFIHNYGIKNTKTKLDRLLMDFSFNDPNNYGFGEITDDKCSHG
jgi:polysaccharide deacetylase family protein (PEP-CTERM system associated)